MCNKSQAAARLTVFLEMTARVTTAMKDLNTDGSDIIGTTLKAVNKESKSCLGYIMLADVFSCRKCRHDWFWMWVWQKAALPRFQYCVPPLNLTRAYRSTFLHDAMTINFRQQVLIMVSTLLAWLDPTLLASLLVTGSSLFFNCKYSTEINLVSEDTEGSKRKDCWEKKKNKKEILGNRSEFRQRDGSDAALWSISRLQYFCVTWAHLEPWWRWYQRLYQVLSTTFLEWFKCQ